MSNKNVIDMTIRANMDISNIGSDISQIQNFLKKVKLSPEAKRSFDNLFDEAITDLEKIQKRIDKGFKTKGDITGFEKVSSGLDATFKKIENKLFKLYNLSDKELFKLDPNLEKDIKAIEKKFANMGEDFPDTIKTNLSKIGKEIDKLGTKAQKKAGQEISDLINSKDYSSALAKAEKQLNNQNKFKYDKNGEIAISGNTLATVDKQIAAYEKIIKYLKEAVNYQDQFNNKAALLDAEKAERFEQSLNLIRGSLGDAQEAAKNAASGFQRVSSGIRDAGEETVNFNSELDSIKQRVQYFFSLTNSVMLFRRILQDTINTTKELDAAMTETAVVTDFSVADMWKDLPRYTNIAKELGTTIKGVYETMTLYYQQGLKTEEVVEVGTETLKMARIAGLDYAKATDFMTAALRGFNMEVNEINAQKVNDVYSELAAITAADTQEIATAMTKTASIASSANMEFETTAAFLSQIIETTRESAETAGTAMKTVIARFTELKKDPAEIGEVDGEIVDANKIETALRTIGVSLRDTSGQFRELDEVFLDISAKWAGLDTNTQRYIATMAAGSRQQSRFIAMMSDYGRTMELVNAANNSAGASQKQFDKTLESLEAKLNQLKDAWDQFTMGIANNTLIKAGVDALTTLINLLNKITEHLPGPLKGIGNLLLLFGGFKAGEKIFRAFSASMLADLMSLSKGTIKAGEHVGESFFSALKKEFSRKNKITDLFKDLINNDFADLKNQKIEIESFFKGDPDTFEEVFRPLNKGYADVLDKIETTKFLTNQGINEDVAATLAKKGLTKEILLEAAAKELGAEASEEELKAKAAELALDQASVPLKLKNTILKGLEALAYDKETKEIKNNTVAKIANWVITKILNKEWLKLLGAIGLVVAAIGLTVGAFKILNHLIETNAEKEERLNKAIELTAESMTEAKEAIDDVKNSMEELQSLENEFDGLIKGTDEWKEKLIEVNNQVLEILQKYPQLAQYLQKDEEGKLSIAEEGWDVLIKQQQQKLAGATWANTVSKNQKEQLTLEDRVKQEIRSSDLTDGEATVRELYNAASIMANRGEYLTKDFDYNSAAFSNAFLGDDLKAVIEKTGGIGEFNKLVGIIKASGIQTENLSSTLATQFISQNEAISGSKYEKGISKLIASQIDIGKNGELSEEVYDALKEYGRFGKDGQSINANRTKIWNEAAIREGITYKQAKEKYSSKDEISSVALEMASEKAAKDLSDSADLIIKGLRKIGLETEDINDEWVNAFESMFSTGLTESDITTLKATTVNFEDLPEEIKSYFKNNAEQYQKFINNQITTAKEQLTSAKSTLDTLEITSLNTSELSAGALKGLADNLNQVFYKTGKEGVDAIAKSFNKVTDSLNQEQLEKFASALNGVDWNSTYAIEDLKNNLYELGIYVDETELNQLTKDIIDFNKATRAVSLEELTNQLQNMQNLSKDIEDRDRGDRTFSKEQMEQLTNAGIEENLFVGFGDSWQYVGTSLDTLTEAIQENTRVTLEETQAKLREEIKTAQAATEFNNLGKGDLTSYGVLNTADRQALLEDFLSTTTATEVAGYSTKSLSTLTTTSAEKLDSGQQTMLNDILKALADAVGQEDYLQTQYDANQRSLGYLNYANKPLNETANVAINGETEIDRTNATNALLEQASYYTELTDEIRAYHEAMEGANEEDKKAAKQQLATGIAIEKRAKELDELDDKVEDHIEGLKKTKKGTEAYEESLSDLTEDMNDAFGTDLTSEFFNPEQTQNLKLLEQAIKGSQSAWNQLIQNMMIATFKSEEFSAEYGLMGEHVTNVTNALNGLSFNVEGTADVTQLVAALFAAEKTGEEVAQFLEDLSLTNIELEVDNDIKNIENLADIKNWDDVAGKIKISATNVNIPAARRSSSFGGGGRNSGSKGGGGGGGSSEKWENPYDSFYNITEDINELLDKRNQLEKEYDLLLQDENASIDDYLDSYKNRLASYQEEIALQQQALKMRQQEQEHLLSKNSKLQKYAWVEDGEVKINFKEIDKVQDQELGEDIEEYISALEENDEAIQEAQDAIQENTLAIEDLMDEWRDTAANFEERVYDALVWEREQQIKEMEEISSALEESNSNLIDAIHEEIDARRRERENEETEKDLSEKQRRLAYLQQDTSGAYEQEILQLQKEITEGQEDYTDTLIDQKIDELEKQNDEAEKQREKQIKIAEYQLENDKERGVIAQQTRDILEDANSSAGWSRVWKLLERSEGFRSLTDTNKKVWTEDTQKEFKETMAYLNGTKGSGTIKQDLKNSNNNNNSGYTPPADRGDQSSSSGGNQSSSGGTQSSSGGDQSSSGGDKKPVESKRSKYSDAVWLGGYDRYYNVGGNWYHTNQVEDINVKDKTLIIKKNQKGTFSPVTSVGTLNFDIKLTEATYGNAEKAMEAFKKSSKSFIYNKIRYYEISEGRYVPLSSIKQSNGSKLHPSDSYVYVPKGTRTYKKYKTGGLADFTGPAWLDGTKSKPELILNQKDTQNFLQLKDVLGSFMKNRNSVTTNTTNGDTIYEIDINVEKISNDYDVEQLAGKIKQMIGSDAAYRNSNFISHLR